MQSCTYFVKIRCGWLPSKYFGHFLFSAILFYSRVRFAQGCECTFHRLCGMEPFT